MIDYLISEKTKKIRLKKSCILKVMKFLIFRDFSKLFFFFTLNLFYFKNIKILFLSPANMMEDVACVFMRQHMNAARVHMCVHVYA